MSNANQDDVFPETVYIDPYMTKPELWLYKGTWLPSDFFNSHETLKSFLNFPLHKSDIIVCTVPKSGTTWCQEIVYRIMSTLSKHENNNKESIPDMGLKFPFLEDFLPGVKEIEQRPSPRLIKTHLPYHLLPKKVHEGYGKVIYVARNPKDVCVSYFHFVSQLEQWSYNGELINICESFLNGKIGWGSWFDHVKTAWEHRNDSNVLFLTYEELAENKRDTISRISDFLGVPLDNKQLDEISEATTFDKMKKDPKTNYKWWIDMGRTKKEFEFMRKGEVGDWRNSFTPEMSMRMNKELIEPLKACGLSFGNVEN